MSQTMIAASRMDPQETGLYSCKISLAGDYRSVVYRGADNPVTLPEIYLLKSMHGADSVTEVIHEKTVSMSPADVVGACQAKYGSKASRFFDQVNITSLPFFDDTIPTREVKEEADRAAATILAGKKLKGKPAKKAATPAEPEPDLLPDDGDDLADL